MIKISEKMKNLKPYSVTKQIIWNNKHEGKIWKLDWNEENINHPEVMSNLKDFINQNLYNFYPDTNASNLIDLLVTYHRVESSNLQIYSGSDDALDDICRVYLNEKDKVVYNHPEYSNFDVFVQSNGAHLIPFIDNDVFNKDLNSFSKFILKENPKLVYISNPNNPTGYLYNDDFLFGLFESFPNILFIIDEAYIHFCGKANLDSVLEKATKLENVIVTRTFSKLFSLAGLRIGYVISNSNIINNLKLIHKSKNVTMLAQISALSVINHYDFYNQKIKEIAISRNKFINSLSKLKYVDKVYQSFSNFVCVKLKAETKDFLDYLELNGVFVRDRSSILKLDKVFRTTIFPNMDEPIKVFLKYEKG
jgi:histidinol-phosphate aminotransferase